MFTERRERELCVSLCLCVSQLLGPDHPDVAKQFCNLAILCSHLGRYDEVEHYYQRALEIFRMELEQDDPNITKTMNNLVRSELLYRFMVLPIY